MALDSLQKVLYYSLDETLGIKKLREGNINKIYNTKILKQRMNTNNIKRQLEDELGYHFKFHRVLSKPYIIYYQGNIDILDSFILGIVGPRKISNYSYKVMEDIFDFIPKYNLVTISGGAPGVDTLCHELSLKNNIPTIMVLGAGIGYYLQHQQRHLMKKIVNAGGLILSEFKLKQKPTNYTFPQRNRIVAGLSDTIFVPAAGKKSGSLITVDFALQTHTSVYSVPASIYDDTSMGSNIYIADGKIKAVIDFDVFLNRHFDGKDKQEKQKSSLITLSSLQKKIVAYIHEQGGEQTIQHISMGLDIPLVSLMSEMTMLEMQGVVYEMKPGVWGCK